MNHTALFFIFAAVGIALAYKLLMDLLRDGEVSIWYVIVLFMTLAATIKASIAAGHTWFVIH